MKKLILICMTYVLFLPTSYSGVGLNAGLGVPFVSQFGLNVTMGPKWTLNLMQNTLDLSIGDAKTKLTMPELSVNWHPFAGSFFIGLGVGQEKLEVTASDAFGNNASAEATATTTIAKLGWMWGKADGGVWFGMDLAFISPSGGEVEIDVNGLSTTSQEYQDLVDSGEKFAETAYMNITFARLGYLF